MWSLFVKFLMLHEEIRYAFYYLILLHLWIHISAIMAVFITLTTIFGQFKNFAYSLQVLLQIIIDQDVIFLISQEIYIVCFDKTNVLSNSMELEVNINTCLWITSSQFKKQLVTIFLIWLSHALCNILEILKSNILIFLMPSCKLFVPL